MFDELLADVVLREAQAADGGQLAGGVVEDVNRDGGLECCYRGEPESEGEEGSEREELRETVSRACYGSEGGEERRVTDCGGLHLCGLFGEICLVGTKTGFGVTVAAMDVALR